PPTLRHGQLHESSESLPQASTSAIRVPLVKRRPEAGVAAWLIRAWLTSPPDKVADTGRPDGGRSGPPHRRPVAHRWPPVTHRSLRRPSSAASRQRPRGPTCTD